MTAHQPIVQDEVLATLAHLWPTAHHDALVQLSIIDAYVQLRADGIEELEVRVTARSSAHRLAGVLGMFGLPHGSDVARQLDWTLADVPSPQELPELRSGASELRGLLDAAAP